MPEPTRTCADLVTGSGYEVVAATPSGERAIELALKERPDLVLMDVAFRDGVSGVQAARAIRAAHDCAVIFMTAYGDPEMWGVRARRRMPLPRPSLTRIRVEPG